MSELRVAHLQPMTLDLFGHDDEEFGTSVRYSVANLALAQARLGMRPTVHLLTSGRPHTMNVGGEAGGVDVVFHGCVQPPRSLGVRGRFARQFSRGMLKALRARAADVVHFHGVRQFHPMYAAVAWQAGRAGLPLVAQDRGGRDVGRIERAAQRFALGRTTAVLASGADSLDELARLGVPGAGLHLVPNGVDAELFHPRGPAGDPARAPAASGTTKILSLARMYDDKDPRTMIGAVAELHRRGRPVELTAIGAGPLRDEVAERARAAGVPATFIEHVPHDELPDHYRAADVMVLTTAAIGEGWNQATLEAMACGLPVVATDVPGVRDAAGGAALLVPPGDPAAVADAVGRLVADAELWRRQRDRGLERVKDLTWDGIARRLETLYRGAREPARR